MKVTRDPELERFKREIDLRAFAASRGYTLDRKESWRGSAVMRHPNGDKIVIKKDHDDHYVYFSLRDDVDNGSIIDFVQRRDGGSLGRVRQILRPWIGMEAAAPAFAELVTTSKDRMEVEREFRRMEDAPAHPYLIGKRGLSPALLSGAAVEGRIKRDARGNAVFPHFDLEGLCGFEAKNEGFTGFARGGEKGLWITNAGDADKRLVVAESAIDALSYFQLFPARGTRYASIGGQMNTRQPDLILRALSRMGSGATLVAAMDADESGERLGETLRQTVQTSSLPGITVTLHAPSGAKDWNDALRSGPEPSFPTARISL